MLAFRLQVTWLLVALATLSLVACRPLPATGELSDMHEPRLFGGLFGSKSSKTGKTTTARVAASTSRAAVTASSSASATVTISAASTATATSGSGASCAFVPKASGSSSGSSLGSKIKGIFDKVFRREDDAGLFKRAAAAKQGDSITVNGFTAKLGKELSSDEAAVFEVTWKGGVSAIAKQPVSLSKAKFDTEVSNTRAAGAAQGNGLFIDSGVDACTGIDWLIQKKLSGENILVTFTGANKPTSKSDCTAKLAKARSAAVDAQVKLGTGAGFVQGDANAANYLFNSDFSRCDIIDFGEVRSVKGQSADLIRAGQVKVMQEDSFPDAFCDHIA